MKRFYALFMLMHLMFFAACTDDNGTTDGGGTQTGTEIQLPSGTPTNFELYADETTGTPADGISFTTTGPWRATVTDTRADATTKAASWVTVTPDHGDEAGDYTITITLGVNTSGEERSATVTIECGTTKLTITIEQKGTTAAGEVPDDGDEEPEQPTSTQLVSSIHFVYGIEVDSQIELTYDTQNRLIRWVETSKELMTDNQVETSVKTVEYEYGDGVVEIIKNNGATRYTVQLNDSGYAERVVRTQEGQDYIVTYTYDAENHLIRTESSDEWADHVWQDGNLVESRNGSPNDATYATKFTFTYTDLENHETPDFICAWNELPTWFEELAWANLLGVGNRNLLESQRGDSEWSYKDDFDIEYEVDASGYVTTATCNNEMIFEVEHVPSNK